MGTSLQYGNGVQTKFDIPGSTNRVVLVNGVLTPILSAAFQSVTLASAPAAAVPVEIRYTDSGVPPVSPPNNPSGHQGAAARYAQKHQPGISRLLGIGDSYLLGNGATTQLQSFYALMAARYAGRLVPANYAFSGRPIPMYGSGPLNYGTGAPVAGQVQIARGDVTFGIFGLNDLRGVNEAGSTGGCGPDPGFHPTLRSKAMAAACQACIPEAAKVRFLTQDQSASNPALTFVGSWTNSLGGNPSARYNNSGSGSVSGTLPKGDLLIFSCMSDSSANQPWTLTVDGVAYQINGRSLYGGWSQDCFVIKLPTNSTHTFTYAANGSTVIVGEYIACVDTSTDFSATLIYSTPGDLGDGSNIGWGQTGFAFNSANAAGLTGPATYNLNNGSALRFGTALDEAFAYLASLGFNIQKANHRVGWRIQDMISADTVHPNDAGHYHIYQRFSTAVDLLLAYCI